MYTVYGNVFTRAMRVLWCLEEIGLDYTHVPASPQSPEILAVNPAGKLPAMSLDDGTVLTDSTAIMTYLADKHDAVTYPAGTVERARQDGITHKLLDELDACLWTASRMTAILPEDKRVPSVVPSLQFEFAKSIRQIEAQFEGPYIAGDIFTVPDIILAHCAAWARSIQFEIESDKILGHVKSLRARPAFRKVVAMGQAA